MEDANDRQCSFCGTSSDEAELIVKHETRELSPNYHRAEPVATICSECVYLFVEVLEEKRQRDDKPIPPV